MCETFAIDNQRDFEVKEHNETYVENVERVDCIFRFWKDDLQAGKAGRLGAPKRLRAEDFAIFRCYLAYFQWFTIFITEKNAQL